jgi:hypothetical protein
MAGGLFGSSQRARDARETADRISEKAHFRGVRQFDFIARVASPKFLVRSGDFALSWLIQGSEALLWRVLEEFECQAICGSPSTVSVSCAVFDCVFPQKQ